MKELIINGVVYARYEIVGPLKNVIFLKVDKLLFTKSLTRENEEFYIKIILGIENLYFADSEYLNV